MNEVTAVLLSWRRKPNLPVIIRRLREQTAPPAQIWLINNDGFDDFGADRVIAVPWNLGECARYMVAARIETEYGMFQDDDFIMADCEFLADAVALYEDLGLAGILGVSGRGLQAEPPHYRPEVRDGRCHIVKGHFQLWQRAMAERVRLPWHPSASDILWSLDMGQGRAVHYVCSEFKRRLQELPRHGVGYEYRPEHWRERDEVCKAWLARSNVGTWERSNVDREVGE